MLALDKAPKNFMNRKPAHISGFFEIHSDFVGNNTVALFENYECNAKKCTFPNIFKM
jgi:hypothetical protein